MYPRRNRSAQRGNKEQPDKDLAPDIEAENIQNEAGNEASLLANIVAGVSNEANIAALSDDPMAHYSGNDLNRLDEGNDLSRHHLKICIILHRFHAKRNRRPVHGIGVDGKLHVIQVFNQLLATDTKANAKTRHGSGF